MEMDKKLQTLLDKQEIIDRLVRYCHGADRRDFPAMLDAFWPEAIDLHGLYNGPVAGMAELVKGLPADFVLSHFACNFLIEFDGADDAHVETVIIARHEFPEPEGRQIGTLGGRYLDRFQRRNGEWRILDRVLVVDWSDNAPSSSDYEHPFWKAIAAHRGASYPNDPWDLKLPHKR